MISLCVFCWLFSDLVFLCFFLLATVVTVVLVVVSSRMSGVSVKFIGIGITRLKGNVRIGDQSVGMGCNTTGCLMWIESWG